MPGMQLSPHTLRPGTGVAVPGQVRLPLAEMAGPAAQGNEVKMVRGCSVVASQFGGSRAARI
jgi:hypothetical protein